MNQKPSPFQHPAALPVTCFLLGLFVRLALIWAVPSNYSFDGFQRWAGRGGLLVQDWLPLTQSVLVFNDWVGGDLYSARVCLAVIASIAMAMASLVVRRLGGTSAGWAFVPLSLFGPALTWTVVPYQEGCYLALLMTGLFYSLQAREQPENQSARWAADILMGACALCRTEGWVVVALYVLWWRDRASLRSLWGIGLWLGWKWGIGLNPQRLGPVSYADWEGLSDRFQWTTFMDSLVKHLGHWQRNGGWLLAAMASAGLWQSVRSSNWKTALLSKPANLFILFVLMAQMASTLGWMVGLETATVRMTLVPGILLAILSAVWLGQNWPSWPRIVRRLGAIALVLLGLFYAADGWVAAHKANRAVRWERVLVLQMEQCDNCYYEVRPRRGLGTRDRHDGCEILQGISDWHHPTDFFCTTWPGEPLRTPTHRARWKKRGYSHEPLISD